MDALSLPLGKPSYLNILLIHADFLIFEPFRSSHFKPPAAVFVATIESGRISARIQLEFSLESPQESQHLGCSFARLPR